MTAASTAQELRGRGGHGHTSVRDDLGRHCARRLDARRLTAQVAFSRADQSAYDNGTSHRDQGINGRATRRARTLGGRAPAWLWLRYQHRMTLLSVGLMTVGLIPLLDNGSRLCWALPSRVHEGFLVTGSPSWRSTASCPEGPSSRHPESFPVAQAQFRLGSCRSYVWVADGQEVGFPPSTTNLEDREMSKLDHTDSPATNDYATVYVAFELSKANWNLGVILPGSAEVEPLHDFGRRPDGAGGTSCGMAQRRRRGPASRCGSRRATRPALMGTGCIAG